MWVTKLLISPVKKGFFAQKRPNLAQNWHFWSIWARPCRLIRFPVGGSVGGCGAQAVSRKTPIYSISSYLSRELYPRVRLMSHWQSLKTRHKVVKIRFEDYPILGQTPQNRI